MSTDRVSTACRRPRRTLTHRSHRLERVQGEGMWLLFELRGMPRLRERSGGRSQADPGEARVRPQRQPRLRVHFAHWVSRCGDAERGAKECCRRSSLANGHPIGSSSSTVPRLVPIVPEPSPDACAHPRLPRSALLLLEVLFVCLFVCHLCRASPLSYSVERPVPVILSKLDKRAGQPHGRNRTGRMIKNWVEGCLGQPSASG